ncbi:MAG: glycosyltransferase family 39 protein [Elainella sp. Prado103]|nr:glycosyltransferase family 39 protein [Elainella sp. Prado103]
MGLIVRLNQLDRKIFWVDEVATAIRIGGYTKAEVTQALTDGQWHQPPDLIAYQQLQPDRALPDLWSALANSPEHAPLYFLLLRGWAQIWGSSAIALRSFSVLCSLLLLGAMYGLSRALFPKHQTARFTVGLVALSPLFIAYAQEARPYSLWLLWIVLSSTYLLSALRLSTVQQNSWSRWGLYGLTLTLCLYTSLLSIGVAIGHGLYVMGQSVMGQSVMGQSVMGQSYQSRSGKFNIGGWRALPRPFVLAWGLAVGMMLPWLWHVAQQWSTLQSNTTWMRLPLPDFARGVIWFYSAAILYFDVPVILQPWWIAASEVLLASIAVIVIGYGFYAVYRQHRSAFYFLLCLGFPVPLLLVGIDLISDGRYSTAPRYLLPFHLAAQLAVGFLFSDRFSERSWRLVTVLILGFCLLSIGLHWHSSPRYLKNRNLHNPGLAATINQARLPLITESVNTIDLLSLSHLLRSDQPIAILPPANAPFNSQSSLSSGSPTDSLTYAPIDPSIWVALVSANPTIACRFLLFNPSPDLQRYFTDRNWQLTEQYRPSLLLPGEFALSVWQVDLPRSRC